MVKDKKIKSKLTYVEEAFEKFEKSYLKWSSKETDKEKDKFFDKTNSCWADCFSLLMMEFDDQSEIKRRIDIYDTLSSEWNEIPQNEYEEDIESIRNKNIELVV